MYKLWRRQLSKPSTSEQNTKRREAEFTQHLSQAIKIMRRKQQFYTRALFLDMSPNSAHTLYNPSAQSPNPRTSFHAGTRQHTSYSGLGSTETLQPMGNFGVRMHDLQSEFEGLLGEEEQNVLSLKSYEEEPFYLSKTFLYTMFVRLLQTFEYSRQKIGLKVKNQEKVCSSNWEKLYEQNKLALTDCYQNLVYFQNFNVTQLISLSNKKQNIRIYSIVPSRVKKNQIALKPLMRLNSTDMRRTHSIEIKPKKNDIEELITKKLLVKQKKLFTEKRIQERKKAKQKPITMKALYGILGIKFPKVQQGYAYRKQMEMDAMERNESIQQERKKWEKKFEQRAKKCEVE